jgi:hypothetical protein
VTCSLLNLAGISYGTYQFAVAGVTLRSKHQPTSTNNGKQSPSNLYKACDATALSFPESYHLHNTTSLYETWRTSTQPCKLKLLP